MVRWRTAMTISYVVFAMAGIMGTVAQDQVEATTVAAVPLKGRFLPFQTTTVKAVPLQGRFLPFQTTTVKAVPLQAEGTTVAAVPLKAPFLLFDATTVRAVPLLQAGQEFEDNAWRPEEENRQAPEPAVADATPENLNNADSTMSPLPTTKISPSPPATLTPSTPSKGKIAWSPYRGSNQEALDIAQNPMTLPFRSPVIIFPNTSHPTGKWRARQQFPQLLNIKPAFSLPAVEVLNNTNPWQLNVHDSDEERRTGHHTDHMEPEENGGGVATRRRRRNATSQLPSSSDMEEEEEHDREKEKQEREEESGRRILGKLARATYGRRKRSTTSYLLASCGGTYRDSLYGVIQSPEFPLYYPNSRTCIYDIELPLTNYTIKFSCNVFTMQGGENCTDDYIVVSPTGDTNYVDGTHYCGTSKPVVLSTSNRLTIKFSSDNLFRYQGFSCTFHAIQENGLVVPGSFGNGTANTYQSVSTGSSFFQAVQCPAVSSSGSTGTSSSGGTSAVGAVVESGLWNGMCGNQNLPAPTGRVVGGWPTQENEFPWMAVVLKTCGTSYCQICGATIVSDIWILTAAHCHATVEVTDLAVLVGDYSLFSIGNNEKFIPVMQKVEHPDYYFPTPLNNDIGLLRLAYPITFSKFVSPLCLPAMGETGFLDNSTTLVTGPNVTELDTVGLDIVGQTATVLGWGMINDQGVYADSLMGVEVQILNNTICQNLYGIITENMMCTSGDNGRGSCYGDSGGPAVVKQPDGTYVQVGILSFGALAGCELGYPSVQMLVHKYIPWIQAVTGVAFTGSVG